MDGFDELKKTASGEWYEAGREAAEKMTKTEGQNVVWNLGYFRQGILDVINSSVMGKPGHPDPDSEDSDGQED